MEDAISAPVDTGTAPLTAPEIAPASPAPAAPAPDTAPAADAKPVFEKTPRGAVERAMAKLNGERERDTGGRFVAKDGQPAAPTAADTQKPAEAPAAPVATVAGSEAPARFNDAAKAAWATAPDVLRLEFQRTFKELEGGMEKHRGENEILRPKAAALDELKDFDELARSTGTTMKEAAANYVGMEQLLRRDIVAGLDKICEHAGVSLVDVAKHVMAAVGPDTGKGADPELAVVKRELADLKASIGKVSTTYEADRNIAALAPHVEAFAAKPENSRFGELENDIIDILSGKGAVILPDKLQPLEKLSEAYRMASLLKPAPAPAPVITAPQTRNPDPAAQTRKGSLSVSGAPGNGSDPSSRKPAPSIRDAIQSARAQVG